ncbi:MAG: protein kinase [Ignavibacteriales bacterium]|nr:protein kinase [Ignavibacteriales bacterium]
MIGQTISHYKILEKLGEGGMGVVYKARDTKLNRDVALKFLPSHVTAKDVDRSRFLLEARSAALLNHPNICIIYGIHDEGERPFIEMEFVDGKTLRELDLAATKVEMSLGYAVQIGEALQEAHSKGIVHRDIKADNIMVNSKSQVKVMDFGLAKIKGSLKLTRTSSTLGTLGYMAPEQIQGGEVDARSDIFAFGAVLFEMLTGRLPFRGEHEAAMMYSILNEQPEPLTKHRSDTPEDLQRIILRALEKDPEDRYQSAADMVSEIRRLQKKTSRVMRTQEIPVQKPETGTLVTPLPSGAHERPSVSKRNLRIAIGATGLVAVAIVVMLLTSKHTVNLNADMSFQVLQIPFTQTGPPAISRDGNWIAYPAIDAKGKWDVYFMNSTGGDAKRITSDSSLSIQSVDISPDGSRVVYDRTDASGFKTEIAIVSTLGGTSKRLADPGAAPRWRPDGQRIGYVRNKDVGGTSVFPELWTMKPDGSDNHREFLDSLAAPHGYPVFSWSPDGGSVVFVRFYPGRFQELVTYDFESRSMRTLTSGKKNIGDAEWTTRGTIVYSSNNSGNTNLWMIPASGGTPVQVTKGSGPDFNARSSADGARLIYLQQQSVSHFWMANTGGARQLTFDDINILNIALSPDGKQIAFVSSLQDPLKPGQILNVMDREGSNRVQLTTSDGAAHGPVWSPNSKFLLYGQHAALEVHDSVKVYLIDPSNPGSTRTLGKGEPVWWTDNQSFSYYRSFQTWTMTIDGSGQPELLADSAFALKMQNGKYILSFDQHSGREGLWIAPVPGLKDAQLPTPKKLLKAGVSVTIEPSGRYIYYVKGVGEMRRMSLPDGRDERITGSFQGLTPQSSIDVSRDGKEIIYLDTRINAKLVMIENLFK